MKAEEKARELIESFSNIKIGFDEKGNDYLLGSESLNEAKQCALICIDEKIELIKSLPISDLMKQDLVENELKVKQKINEL